MRKSTLDLRFRELYLFSQKVKYFLVIIAILAEFTVFWFIYNKWFIFAPFQNTTYVVIILYGKIVCQPVVNGWMYFIGGIFILLIIMVQLSFNVVFTSKLEKDHALYCEFFNSTNCPFKIELFSIQYELPEPHYLPTIIINGFMLVINLAIFIDFLISYVVLFKLEPIDENNFYENQFIEFYGLMTMAVNLIMWIIRPTLELAPDIHVLYFIVSFIWFPSRKNGFLTSKVGTAFFIANILLSIECAILVIELSKSHNYLHLYPLDNFQTYGSIKYITIISLVSLILNLAWRLLKLLIPGLTLLTIYYNLVKDK